MVLLAQLIDIYCWILILDVLMSWIVQDPRNELRRWLSLLTEPVLRPIRGIVRTPGLDFSPMIAVLVLQALRRALL